MVQTYLQWEMVLALSTGNRFQAITQVVKLGMGTCKTEAGEFPLVISLLL